MAFSKETEYPSGFHAVEDLALTPSVVSTGPIQISGVLVHNIGGAQETVIFRPSGGGTTYFEIEAANNSTAYYDVRCELPSLEIVGDTAAPGADVTIFYYAG